MPDADTLPELRDIVGRIAHQIGQAATRKTLDDALLRVGLPASTAGDTKAERTDSSLAALADDRLIEAARTMLAASDGLDADRRTLQDLVWATENHPRIPKRARREIARALTGSELNDYYPRFRALLGSLFDLGGGVLWGGRDLSVGARIDRHFQFNPDWTMEEVFDAVGAIDGSSDRRFGLLVQGITSSGTVPDEDAQRRLVAQMNPPLTAAGLELRETGTADGYPVFEVVATRSRKGRPKNLIFASSRKPDLRLSDAIDNEIEILSDPAEVLVYDRPITADGVLWRDLQAWFKETHRLGSDQDAKTQLYRRLRQSLPENSPPQRLLFDLYYEIHGAAVHYLPALLPEVWLYWDPQTVKMRGPAALLQLRMDFLLLVPGGGRIVLEVDGRNHYAVERRTAQTGQQWIADPPTYARTMAGSRKLTLAGYEVHRFGAHELLDRRQGRVTLTAFFADLFHRHHVITPLSRATPS
ncbi:hypothetical protein ACIG87_31670 [Micromonospora sp. NPDC051925]|uniref:AbiJ-related protein n=1 Tax=Micromonospora sp. NPDC051925 TaxID=3364288 RepID=UPI0037CC47DB